MNKEIKLNNVVLVGNLVETPKKTEKGSLVFTIAVNTFKDSPDFISCVASKNTIPYLEKNAKKGDCLVVNGFLSSYKKEYKGISINQVSVVVNKVKWFQLIKVEKTNE